MSLSRRAGRSTTSAGRPVSVIGLLHAAIGGEPSLGRVLHSVGLLAEVGGAELLELGGVAGDRVCGAECLFGVSGQGLVEDLVTSVIPVQASQSLR